MSGLMFGGLTIWAHEGAAICPICADDWRLFRTADAELFARHLAGHEAAGRGLPMGWRETIAHRWELIIRTDLPPCGTCGR